MIWISAKARLENQTTLPFTEGMSWQLKGLWQKERLLLYATFSVVL
jgi:hypothetical protein